VSQTIMYIWPKLPVSGPYKTYTYKMRESTTSYTIRYLKSVVKVRGDSGRLSPPASLRPHLLKTEPSLLLAEPMTFISLLVSLYHSRQY